MSSVLNQQRPCGTKEGIENTSDKGYALLDLPDDVLGRILSSLDEEELKHSVPLWSGTCRRLSRLLIRSIEFRYPDSVSVSKKIALFPCAETVAIHGVDGYSMGSILKDVHVGLVRLERLVLKGVCIDQDAMETLTVFKGRLREIEFVNVDFDASVKGLHGVVGDELCVLRMQDCRGVSCEDLRVVLSGAKNLEELSLEGMQLCDDVFLGVHERLSFLNVSSSCSFTWRGICHLRTCRRLKRLVLSACYNIDDEVCKAIKEAVPQVEELGLFECGEHLGRQGLEHLSCLVHLKTLDFGYVSGCFESKDIEGMVSKLKKLKVLKLSGTSYVDNTVLQACVDHLPVLEKLDISECQEITRDGFMVLRNFKMLKDLNLGWNARVTDDVLEYLPRTLHRLDVSFCSRLSGAGLCHVAKLKNLNDLCLRRCRKIGNRGIEVLTSGCTRLSKLDISFTQIHAKALCGLQRLPALRYLDMSDCKYATTVMGMASLCLVKSLEELNLSMNPRLDDGCLHAISFHPGLRVLSIRHCPEVSCYGVLECRRLRRLKKLDISGCSARVSSASICTVASKLNAHIVYQ